MPRKGVAVIGEYGYRRERKNRGEGNWTTTVNNANNRMCKKIDRIAPPMCEAQYRDEHKDCDFYRQKQARYQRSPSHVQNGN